MTDKVQKIKDWIIEKQNELLKWTEYPENEGAYRVLRGLDTFIDSLQEEPVSSIWHNASEKSNKPENVVIINPFDNTGEVLTKCVDVYQGHIWAYTSELLKLSNVQKTVKNWKEPVSEELEEASKNYALNNTPWDDCKDEIQESFKAGANWQKAKDESTTEDLGEYINELSKQFPEVSFAKLSRIVVRAAKWQKDRMMKDAIKTL